MTNGQRRRELEKIRKAHGGRLNPPHVVEAASSPKHPLHGDFEWDDTEAAHQYRLDQARHMIRVVVIFTDTEDEEPTRAYVSMMDDRTSGGGYRTLVDVMSEPQMRNQLLAEAFKEMEGFQHKYRRLAELANVFKAMRMTTRKAVGQTAMSK